MMNFLSPPGPDSHLIINFPANKGVGIGLRTLMRPCFLGLVLTDDSIHIPLPFLNLPDTPWFQNHWSEASNLATSIISDAANLASISRT